MFLSNDQESADGFASLLEKKKQVQELFKKQLAALGMRIDEFDKLIQNPANFCGADWVKMQQELREFKDTLDLLCFGQDSSDSARRREQMRERGNWIQMK